MVVLIILGLVGAVSGLAFAFVLFLIAAASLSLVIPTFLLGLFAPLTGIFVGVPAAFVLPAILLTIFKEVVGWYAVGSLSNTTAVDAAVAAPAPAGPTVVAPNLLERFGRGYMIGMNAGLNFGIWLLIAPGVGIVLGTIVAIVNFLAAIPMIAPLRAYQFILGWLSWLMPMSWLSTGLGLLLFIINLVSSPFFGGVAIRIDVTTGSIESAGGITGITGFAGGFNLGNFTFLTFIGGGTTFTGPGLSAHETGHTLNVAAFGSIWHLICGGIEENIAPFARPVLPFGRGSGAYSELLANSHFTGVGGLVLIMW